MPAIEGRHFQSVKTLPSIREVRALSDKKEIDSAKPLSSKLIELDKFIEFFQVDPHYFERSFLLIPNNSEKPYALLRKVLEQTGLAAIWKMTMSTKEHFVLIHYYQNAIVVDKLTTELDPSVFHERYKERIESLIKSKKEKLLRWRRRNQRSLVAKSIMEALRETADSLK